MSPFMNLDLGTSVTFSIFPVDKLSYIVRLSVNVESVLDR